MRLDVLGTGFLQASGAFEDANRLAALYYDALTRALQDYGAMAGDASIAEDFSAAYDEGAAACVDTLVDVVAALANLGAVTRTTIENHRRADLGSVLGGATLSLDAALPDAGFVQVVAATVPSALGGDSSSLPGWANVVLDHVEGFVWPDADIDRLREAASTWRDAFDTEAVASYCDLAVDGLWLERSPEVPSAVGATEDLAVTIRRVGDELESLALACEAYADQVEARREEILDLVRDLIRDALIIQSLGVVAGIFTAGGATAGAAAANIAKFAAAAPRFARIVTALRTLAGATASTIRTVTTTVSFLRLRLAGFVGARAVLAKHVGITSALELGRWAPGWLTTHETRGSHTLARHVGKSEDELRLRFLSRRPPPYSSTFTDEATAEAAISSVIQSNREMIEGWLSSGGGRLTIIETFDSVVGQSMEPGGLVHDVSGVRTVLVHDSAMPDGYRILTSFPQP